MIRTIAAAVIFASVSAPAAAQSLRAGDWLRIDFHARVQTDVRRITTLDAEEFEPSPDVARRRVGIEGRVGRLFDYQIEYEAGSREWRDVYLDFRRYKSVRAQAGMFKVPFGLEETTSVAKLDFVDRSLISERLAPGRDRGVMVHGKLLSNRIAYEGGVFQHDGDNARTRKATRSRGAGLVAGRLVVEPFQGSRREIADLHLGAAINSSSIEAGFPSVRARTSFGSSFFDSDVWVQGRRQRTGLEAAWRPGPFSLQAEYIRLSDERQNQAVDDTNLRPFTAHGWYVSGSYRIRRFEAASRLEKLSFGDATGNPDASTSARAEIVEGAFDRAATFGINVYINRWLKLQVNAIHDQLRTASFWSRVLRVQVAI